MKLWIQSTLLTVFLLIVSGCGTTPKPKDTTVTDKTLPIIKLSNSGVFADMNAIAFEWKSINDSRVNGIYVYKQSLAIDAEDKKLKFYKTINNRFATHFVDSDIKPNSNYVYSFTTFTKNSESSPSSLIRVKSLPVLDSISWIHNINGMPKSAKIIWRPHTNEKVNSYIIERKTIDEKEYKKIATVIGRLNAEYIDNDLKDNYIYEYRIRVVTFDSIVSVASKSVRAITKELPKMVTNIVATNNLPKKIKLNWSESFTQDFQNYNLYRSNSFNGKYKLIAKLHNNRYIDKIDEDAKQYFYRVSVIDKDNLESKFELNTVKGYTLSKPLAPSGVQSTLLNNQIEIIWKNSDNRVKSYIVVRKEKDGWFNKISTKYKNIKTKKFVDKNIKAESTYWYEIYSIDKNGIISNPSKEIEIVTLKSNSVMQIKDNKTVFTEMSIESDEAKIQTVNAVQDLELSEK